MKLKLLLCLLCVNSFLSAQVTLIPDPNFEQHFINMGADSVQDGQILTAIAQSFTTLNVTGLNISDLTGIEDFINLTELQCANNNLTSIDVSTLSSLQVLNFSNNSIATIDVSSNTGLEFLDCSDNNLGALDVSFNTVLDNLNFDNNNISSIDLSSNTAIQTLNCAANGLSVLDLSSNTNLKTIQCPFNNIAVMDVTNMVGLRNLFCGNNNISVLDVSSNSDLIRLSCEFNQVDFIDTSAASGLIFLNVRNNNLEGLNIQNGNNTNVTFYDSRFNTPLSCIQVDDVAYSISNWLNVDNPAAFNLNCHFNETFVPDNNFENALITLGYDTVLDDYVPNANIESVTSLNLFLQNINDLTGIEGFRALETLNCARNNLSTLDVSENTNLISLNCNRNALTQLSITDGSGSQQLNLLDLQCGENNLTGLSTNFYPNLVSLNCANNNISNLNSLFANLNLESLICNNNAITSLNLNDNSALIELDARDNLLTELSVRNGNNINIVVFNTLNNPSLNCIEVDDAVYSMTNWTNIDSSTVFSEDCSTLSISDSDSESVHIFPNPVVDYLTISNGDEVNSLSIYNLQGKLMITFNEHQEDYDISSLNSGFYLLKVKFNDKVITKKLLKN